MPAPSPTAAGSARLPSSSCLAAAAPEPRAASGSPWPARLAAPLLLTLLALPSLAGSGASRIEVAINGMVCSFCAQGVERKLRSLPATESVNVNLEQRLVLLTLRPGATIADEQLRSLIRNAGFDVRQIRRLPPAP